MDAIILIKGQTIELEDGTAAYISQRTAATPY